MESHSGFPDHEDWWCQSQEADSFSSWMAPWWALLQLVPLALDPLPEALDLDLRDLEGWQVPDPFGLLPEAQDLEWDLSSSMAVAGRGPSARQGQCLPWGCCLRSDL